MDALATPPTFAPSPLAQRLKAARTAAGLSQQGLAEKAGVKQSQISRIEAGQSIPELATMLALATALDIKIDDVTGDAPPADQPEATAIRLIPVDQLFASPLNPRRRIDPAHAAELAASIKDHGLLQALTARPTDAGYEVFIGGTRLAALRALAGQDWPEEKLPGRLVEVKVVDVDDLTLLRMAVAENVNRQDMHPLDEGEAFAAMLERDAAVSTAAIADAYGKTKRWVEERIRVARNLAPPLAAAFQDGKLRWEQARALSRFPKEAQAAAGDEKQDFSNATTAQAVNKLKNIFPPVAAALFDVDVYVKAGGKILPDDDGDAARCADTALFRRLQRGAIDARIDAARAAGRWVEEYSPDTTEKYEWWQPDYEKEYSACAAGDPDAGLVILACGDDLRKVVFFENIRRGKPPKSANGGDDKPAKDPADVGPSRLSYAAKAKTAALQAALTDDIKMTATLDCLALMGWDAISRVSTNWDQYDESVVSDATHQRLEAWRDRLGRELFDDGQAAATPKLAAGWRLLRLRFQPLSGPHALEQRYYSYVPDADAAQTLFGRLVVLKPVQTADLHAALVAARVKAACWHTPGSDWLSVEIAHHLALDMADHWRIDNDYLALLKSDDLTALMERVNGRCRLNHKPTIPPEEWEGAKTVAAKRALLSVHIQSCDVRLIPPEIDISQPQSTIDRLRDWSARGN